MTLKDQFYLFLISEIKRKKRFIIIELNNVSYLFDGISYSFYEIDEEIKQLLIIQEDSNLIEKITNLSKSPIKERFFYNMAFIFSKKYQKLEYKSNKKIAFLNLNIGSLCNLDCIYCFRNKYGKSKSKIEIIKQSIDFLINNNPNVDSYSIAMDLSSEIFMERDVVHETIDYLFQKECYLFENDEFLIGDALSFYRQLPETLKTRNCNTNLEAMTEINKLLQRKDLLKQLNIDSLKNVKPYLYQQSKISQFLPCWKLVRLNHWGLEAFYPDYIKHKEKKSISLWFMSNGTLLTENDINLIKGLEINPFLISLDGPEEIHNKLRPYSSGKGTYQDVINSIKLLQENNINVKISLVLTKLYPKPFELVNFLLSLNIYQVKMTLVRNCKELEFSKSSIKELLVDYQLLFNELEKSLLTKDFHLFKLLADDISLRPLHLLLNKTMSMKRCMWNEEMIVSSNGDIYPCTYTCGIQNFIIGNVFDNKYEISLSKELFVDNRKKCKNCWARYLCGGTCYFNTYAVKHRIDTFEDIECIVNKFFCERCVHLFLIIKLNRIRIEKIFE